MKKPQTGPFDQSDCPYAPGEVVPGSGLYEICHYDQPRSTVVFTIPAVFPYCRACGDKVRYKQVRAVPHISEDPDFGELVSDADNPKAGEFSKHLLPQQLGIAHGLRYPQQDLEAGGSG